jgi:alkylation response protein AidB-like acyl-CoA dehydrogenase
MERSLGHPPSAAGRRALELVRRFLADTALPLVETFEREHGDGTFALEPDGRLAAPVHELKRAMHRAAASAGVYCPHLPAVDGGLGLGLVDCFHVQEEVYGHGLRGQQWALAWTDGPSPLVSAWGAGARDRWLRDLTAGRITCCFALTEPGAGSDFPALRTTARRDGDGWRLSGEKHLITGAPQAELAHVLARADGAAREELTCFLVPLDADGVERGRVQQTIMADGQTGPIELHDVRVGPVDVVGGLGEGRALAFRWINWARTRRGGMCSGLARFCSSRALAYAREREVAGRPIAELGSVAAMLADLTIDVEAMCALSLELLGRLDARGTLWELPSADDRRDVSVLKTFCDETLERVADRAIQVHGGRGLLAETGLERVLRVARNLRIPAGTVEVQRAIIGKALLG